MHNPEQRPPNDDPAEDSELDAEGEDIDDEYEMPYAQQPAAPQVEAEDEEEDGDDDSSDSSGDSSSTTTEVEASNVNSESEEEWKQASDEDEEAESKVSEVEDDELEADSADSADSEPIDRKRKRNSIPQLSNVGRKRKASDEDLPPAESRIRRRRSDVGSTSAGADRSPSTLSGDDSSRPQRPRRPKRADRDFVTIKNSEGISLIVSFCLDPHRMQSILTSRPKKNRYKERKKKKILVEPIMEEEAPHYPPIPTTHGSGLIPFLEREMEDTKSKPYGGILDEGEADTNQTFPLAAARHKFEEARLKAEDDWKKKMEDTNNVAEPTKPSQKMSGPPSKIKCINFGGFEIDTWNAAPYPEEYSRNKILYICEFCLKYMNSDFVAWRHKLKCGAMNPPGDEIYRDGKFSFFEVDGRKNPVYCQNLCLLAKLFLGSKTLYIDVEPFLFYVMTENDDLGCHFVGYFSKEKRSSSMNNVSCILVLPIYQRRGFGHMLIEFSYLLTKVEEKTGSPEKPLSDMGLVSYRGYWRLIMCYELVNQKDALNINELSKRTGMTPDDVISALEGLRALVRDPVSKKYALRLDRPYYKEYIANYEKKKYPRISPGSLVWVPYVMNRGLTQHYEGGGHISTVAQRDDEDDEEEASDKMDIDTAGGFATSADGELAEIEEQFAAEANGIHKGHEADDEDEANGGDGPSTPRPVSKRKETPKSEKLNPTRYEVFPPASIPRKRGRPPGSTKKNSQRAIKAALAAAAAAAVAAPPVQTVQSNGSPVLRRTRSTNTDSSLNNGKEKEHDSEADAEGEDE